MIMVCCSYSITLGRHGGPFKRYGLDSRAPLARKGNQSLLCGHIIVFALLGWLYRTALLFHKVFPSPIYVIYVVDYFDYSSLFRWCVRVRKLLPGWLNSPNFICVFRNCSVGTELARWGNVADWHLGPKRRVLKMIHYYKEDSRYDVRIGGGGSWKNGRVGRGGCMNFIVKSDSNVDNGEGSRKPKLLVTSYLEAP